MISLSDNDDNSINTSSTINMEEANLGKTGEFEFKKKHEDNDYSISGIKKMINTEEKREKSNEFKPQTYTAPGSELVFNAYLNSLMINLELLKNNLDKSFTYTGKITKATESYLNTLDNIAEFRIYLTGMLLVIRNNYMNFDNDKVEVLINSVKSLQDSPLNLNDIQKSLDDIYGSGLKPLKKDKDGQ